MTESTTGISVTQSADCPDSELARVTGPSHPYSDVGSAARRARFELGIEIPLDGMVLYNVKGYVT